MQVCFDAEMQADLETKLTELQTIKEGILDRLSVWKRRLPHFIFKTHLHVLIADGLDKLLKNLNKLQLQSSAFRQV